MVFSICFKTQMPDNLVQPLWSSHFAEPLPLHFAWDLTEEIPRVSASASIIRIPNKMGPKETDRSKALLFFQCLETIHCIFIAIFLTISFAQRGTGFGVVVTQLVVDHCRYATIDAGAESGPPQCPDLLEKYWSNVSESILLASCPEGIRVYMSKMAFWTQTPPGKKALRSRVHNHPLLPHKWLIRDVHAVHAIEILGPMDAIGIDHVLDVSDISDQLFSSMKRYSSATTYDTKWYKITKCNKNFLHPLC